MDVSRTAPVDLGLQGEKWCSEKGEQAGHMLPQEFSIAEAGVQVGESDENLSYPFFHFSFSTDQIACKFL